jgi:hypothetical protein
METSFTGRGLPRRRGRRRHQLLKLVLIFVVVLGVVYVGLTPWAFHIGGRFSPLARWSGYGQVTGSNGGRYELFTSLNGGLVTNGGHGGVCDQFSGCDTLQGTARLCTESGVTYTFQISGEVRAWLSTNGAHTVIDLSGGSPRSLPFLVSFAGAWHGPELAVANTDDAFTQVFTPRGAIRTATSTADDGHASVVLRYGTAGGFAAACRALTSRSG